jgi:DNA-binding MarR family transcriptional regulator
MFHVSDGEEERQEPLIALIDSLSRLQGRLSSTFASARPAGFSHVEMTVLNAVTGASRPPTVPQIGRSLGHARQVIQRAANGLLEAGLIEVQPNPDHKRASLLVSTPRGVAVKADADARGAAIARSLEASVDVDAVRKAVQLLDELRTQLDEYSRSTQRATSTRRTERSIA